MGLLNKTKKSSDSVHSDTSLKEKFEEIKNIPLPTRQIRNVAVESCCGCGCDTTWFHVVGDPGVELNVSEDTFMDWDKFDKLVRKDGVNAYYDRYIQDPNDWDSRYYKQYHP